MKQRSVTRVSSKEQIVLFAIGDRRMPGTDIQERIKEYALDSSLPMGTLYSILKSLEGKRLLRSFRELGSKQKYYSLTEKGVQKVKDIFDVSLDLLGEDFFHNMGQPSFDEQDDSEVSDG